MVSKGGIILLHGRNGNYYATRATGPTFRRTTDSFDLAACSKEPERYISPHIFSTECIACSKLTNIEDQVLSYSEQLCSVDGEERKHFSLLFLLIEISFLGTLLCLILRQVFSHWKAYQREIRSYENRRVNLEEENNQLQSLERRLEQATQEESFRQEINEYEEERCAICQEDFKEGAPVLKLIVCSHIFHKGCLQAVVEFRQSNRCPICNQEVI